MFNHGNVESEALASRVAQQVCPRPIYLVLCQNSAARNTASNRLLNLSGSSWPVVVSETIPLGPFLEPHQLDRAFLLGQPPVDVHQATQ